MRSALRLALACLALGPAPASAVPLTVHFTGTIFLIDPPLGAPFAYGQAGSGSFQIDSATFDDAPFVGVGIYRGASNFSFTFGTYTATSAGGTFDDFVRVNDATTGNDSYTAETASGSGPTLLDWYFPKRLELVLNGSGPNAFTSDALPVSLDLADFSSGSAVVEFGSTDPGDLAKVALTLTSISVPEPAALLLLTLAGLGLRASQRA
jgi:hypothetical protein